MCGRDKLDEKLVEDWKIGGKTTSWLKFKDLKIWKNVKKTKKHFGEKP
jgi:hypothetical protein